MSNSALKRTFAFTTAVIFLAFLMLSPYAELFCGHDHSCCTRDCPACLAANVFSDMHISTRAMLCITAILLFIYIRYATRFGELGSLSSPVAMKTKITS
jgi:hypothetical protein